MLTQASAQYLQFRRGWGPCPGNRIVLVKALELLSWLTIICCFSHERKNKTITDEEKWLKMNELTVYEVKYLFQLKDPQRFSQTNQLKMHNTTGSTQSTMSQMSLTCQGCPGELYPLLHEAQPSNSCWQSCFSANRPLTWWTDTRMGNTERLLHYMYLTQKHGQTLQAATFGLVSENYWELYRIKETQ